MALHVCHYDKKTVGQGNVRVYKRKRESGIMKTPEEVVQLITIAQDMGASELKRKWAVNDLLADIIQYRMDYHIAQYIRDITVSGIDKSDVQQTFTIGCAGAIEMAKVGVGDPMMFILQKGKWAVVDLLRKHYRGDLRQYCHKCSKETRVHAVAGVATCPSCGAVGDKLVERICFNNLDDGTVLTTVANTGLDLQSAVVSDMVVQEFRSRLSGRKLDVFDLIVVKGYDRDSCDNYIKAVAEILGVTSSNINIRLRQIKEEWVKFVNEGE